MFCGFLREIGRGLGKPVLMDPEGGYGHPVLGFDVEADRVVLLAEPLVSHPVPCPTPAGQVDTSGTQRVKQLRREPSGGLCLHRTVCGS